MDLKEFTVGQKVGILAVRQRDRRERTGVITRIGRKYIYAKMDNSPYELQFDGFSDHPFLIFNDGTYSGDYHLYPSEKAMMEDEERKELSFKLRKYISERNLSLDQLRKIQKIAFPEEPTSDSGEELELNEEQLARNDEIFDAVQELCKVLTEKEDLEWNMFFIGQIADYAAEVLAENGEKVRFYSIVSDSEGNGHIEEYVSK